MYRCTRARVGDRFERVSERKRHSRPQSGGSLADWRTVYARTRSALRFHCPPVPDRERSASWGQRERERDTTAALRREFRGECRVERASGMESRVFLSSPLAGARRVVLHTCSTVGARAGLGESHQ